MSACPTCAGAGPHVEATDCPTPEGLDARLLNALTHKAYREIEAAGFNGHPVRPIIRRYLIELWIRATAGTATHVQRPHRTPPPAR